MPFIVYMIKSNGFEPPVTTCCPLGDMSDAVSFKGAVTNIPGRLIVSVTTNYNAPRFSFQNLKFSNPLDVLMTIPPFWVDIV